MLGVFRSVGHGCVSQRQRVGLLFVRDTDILKLGYVEVREVRFNRIFRSSHGPGPLPISLPSLLS